MTQGAVRAAGSVPPSSTSPQYFKVVVTDTTAVIYWDGTNGSSIVPIFRADGSVTRIPPNNITITGLTLSTSYNVLPYWTPNNLCTIGWVPGDAGSPKIGITGTPSAYQQQQQSLYGREPLSYGSLTFKTNATSTPSTSTIGSGGDYTAPPKACVLLGTDIDTLDGLPYETKNYPCSEWWHLESESGRTLYCTPDHPLYTWDGRRIEARDVVLGEVLCTRDGDEKITMSGPHRRVCTKVQVTMPKLHLFYANGFLSHNLKANQN